LQFFMSADGGAHWESVIPGVEHTFTNTGYELLWRANIIGPEDESAYIYEISIDFEYEEPSPPGLSPLWLGIIIGGGVLALAIIIVVITVVVRKSKTAPTR
ncbi:MAG: GGIII-like transmembrane region-containing protein, partial [Candidatus Heimdallarchaeota archaeon]